LALRLSAGSLNSMVSDFETNNFDMNGFEIRLATRRARPSKPRASVTSIA
jgi:hypothetical protein